MYRLLESKEKSTNSELKDIIMGKNSKNMVNINNDFVNKPEWVIYTDGTSLSNFC